MTDRFSRMLSCKNLTSDEADDYILLLGLVPGDQLVSSLAGTIP